MLAECGKVSANLHTPPETFEKLANLLVPIIAAMKPPRDTKSAVHATILSVMSGIAAVMFTRIREVFKNVRFKGHLNPGKP